TVHQGLVYTLGTEGHLCCLDAKTGDKVWMRELKKDYGVKSPIWGFAAHPLVDGKKLICIVGGDGSTVVAFDKDTGKELWKALTAIEPGYCPPMIYEAGGTRQLIVWHGESVNGLDPETGNVYWSQAAPTYQGMSISTPRKSGDLLFVSAYPDTSVMLRLDSANRRPKSPGEARRRRRSTARSARRISRRAISTACRAAAFCAASTPRPASGSGRRSIS
ncbi:MAG TPA: PQQ-binding-like beta-propeller repeat protein, partial [Pirellulales bacterium]|nr:PQQ-binding-like beta-propeller repeat protein [Pirellulales bacterium]